MGKQISYKTPGEKSVKYAAHNCVFGTQGFKDDNINVYMDGNLDAILKIMTSLFQALNNKSKDAGYYYIEACMKILSNSVGLTPEDIDAESKVLEENPDVLEIK